MDQLQGKPHPLLGEGEGRVTVKSPSLVSLLLGHPRPPPSRVRKSPAVLRELTGSRDQGGYLGSLLLSLPASPHEAALVCLLIDAG